MARNHSDDMAPHSNNKEKHTSLTYHKSFEIRTFLEFRSHAFYSLMDLTTALSLFDHTIRSSSSWYGLIVYTAFTVSRCDRQKSYIFPRYQGGRRFMENAGSSLPTFNKRFMENAGCSFNKSKSFNSGYCEWWLLVVLLLFDRSKYMQRTRQSITMTYCLLARQSTAACATTYRWYSKSTDRKSTTNISTTRSSPTLTQGPLRWQQ